MWMLDWWLGVQSGSRHSVGEASERSVLGVAAETSQCRRSGREDAASEKRQRGRGVGEAAEMARRRRSGRVSAASEKRQPQRGVGEAAESARRRKGGRGGVVGDVVPDRPRRRCIS